MSLKEEKADTDTQGEGDHVMTEAEAGVMQLPAKDACNQQLLKGQGRIPPWSLQRAHVPNNTRFRALAS